MQSRHPPPTSSQPVGVRGLAGLPPRRPPEVTAIPLEMPCSSAAAPAGPLMGSRSVKGPKGEGGAASVPPVRPPLLAEGRAAPPPKQLGPRRLGPSQSTSAPAPRPSAAPGPLLSGLAHRRSDSHPPSSRRFHLDFLPDAGRHVSRPRLGLPGSAPFTQSLRGSAPSSQPCLAPIRVGSLGRRSRRQRHSHRKVSGEPSEAWAAPPRSHFEKLPPVAVQARLGVT